MNADFQKTPRTTAQTAVCILGMHRSGTSVIARILNLMGVDLGPVAHHLKPNTHNPKGFWEHRAIVDLNNEILAASGGSWHEPPVLARVSKYRSKARAIVQSDFAHAPLWGWKDPRTCLTLPFWQWVVPDLTYVLCFRNPAEVIRSLQQRDGFSLEKSLYLWLVYTHSAISRTVGAPCCLVFYENLLERSPEECEVLSNFIGTPLDEKTRCAIDGFIDGDLRHHIVSARSLSGEKADAHPLLQEAQTFYEKLKRIRCLDRPAASEALRQAIDAIAPTVQKQEKERKAREYRAWTTDLRNATAALAALIPPQAPFILVDEDQWDAGRLLPQHRPVPFPECNGRYWGPPPTDEAAIQELERLRKSGAGYIAFGWSAFWWLDYYRELRQYLHTNFQCLLNSRLLVVFDLRT